MYKAALITDGPASRRTILQFAKFVLAGAVNALFGYGVFVILIYFGAGSVVALVLTYAIGVPFNFVTTGKMVFAAAQWSRFMPFVIAYVIIFVFNACVYALIATMIADPLMVQALCVPIVAIFSFLLFKAHVFNVQS